MPNSKKRKDAGKKRTAKPDTSEPKTRWAKKMHSSHFMFLKNDPDFHTFAKLGRAINCLTCELVNVETYRPQFLSTVRNCLAFHLDQTDEVTTRTATGMKPGNHTIMCGDGTSNADYYFEFADHIDMAFLMDENPLEHSLKETADAVVNMLASRAVDLLTAVHTFQNHLWKITAKAHVY